MRLLVFLLVAASMVTAGSVTIKTLVFPSQTDTSVVEVVPLKPMQLKAFTLCMKVAMESLTPPGRDIILFAYRSVQNDELTVWLEKDGRLSLYLDKGGVFFTLPQLGPLETHLCLTWESRTGSTSFFLNGRKSLAKIYGKGLVVPPGGKVILGQDADTFLGNFETIQSFVGEMSDVNMWDRVLSASDIQDLYSEKRVPRGNVFDWERVRMKPAGEVQVVTREL